MENSILSYSKVGNIDLFSGRNWLYQNRKCPYCSSCLTIVGSYHTDCRNIIQIADDEYFCVDCGNRNARADLDREWMEYEDKIKAYYPEAVSPLACCLLEVVECNQCGWWYAIQDDDQCNNGAAVVAGGILERFDLTSASVPLEVLHYELANRAERISKIHPNRMEDLVGSILAGVYDCEVHQLGYSRDGGVDLLLLKNDGQIAVQVKRRENNLKKEPVSLVREFLGASLLTGNFELIYITSGSGFTKGAREAAKSVIDIGLVNSYKLIDGDKFSSLVKTSSNPIWSDALRKAVERRDTPQIPNPFEFSQNIVSR